MSKAAHDRYHRDRRETTKVKRLYKELFDRSWPGYRLEWGVLGFTSRIHKQIALACDKLLEDPWTVIHELVHVRYPTLKHGKVFDKIVRSLYMKAKRSYKWPNRSR